MFSGSALRQHLQLNNTKCGVAAACGSVAGEAPDASNSPAASGGDFGASTAANSDVLFPAAAKKGSRDFAAARTRSHEETVQLGNGVPLVSDVAIDFALLAHATRDAGHLGLPHMLV